jgi:16S rRNA processing protein RimM
VRVRLHWPDSDALRHLESIAAVLPDGTKKRLEIESVRAVSGAALVKFAGPTTRNDAETLRDAVLWVPRSELPEPKGGEFYLADLVGAEVVVSDGSIGIVTEIRCHATVDSLVIRTQSGKLLEQPLCAPWVEDVDVDARRITLRNRDGLF